ncbi:hypothetical protein FY528_11715 [Hymenobacter lutimineralis]|uniref:Prolyl-tRNA synthetase n=1 Tax=Hymenobacter lutimineralis TaxID=2606448 RepID=A0A5D6V0U5_9BACT|nr:MULTISPECIES: hypothetical protein [Hymenobacter]QIX61422.1 hypothetical protein HER32_09615 [Hymenobacter sp. BT18]TYZ08875.1 hypothetical protein FY528_11715 [Hymenobacter lutimineralis]
MKTYLTSCLSAVALLALGGCASIPAVTSTETDGVYYSSKDRTTENPAYTAVVQNRQPDVADQQSSTTAPASSPETQYDQGGTYSSSGTTVYTDDAYYDAYDYDYAARIRRFHQPSYWSFAPSYYSYAYTNSWDPWGYNPYAYSPWAYRYGYDPYGFGYGGPYVSINIGTGWGYRPWGGWGGYGWGYRTGYYNGYYNGYYDNPYYGGGNWGNGGWANGGSGRRINYGPRRDRSSNVTAGSGIGRDRLDGTRTSTSGGRGSQPTTPPGNGGLVGGSTAPAQPSSGRGRPDAANPRGRSTEATTRFNEGTPATTRTERATEAVPASTTDATGARPAENVPSQQPEARPRRRMLDLGEASGDDQPRRPRTREAAPASTEQPARSYERPSRSYEPSSTPSRSSAPAPSNSGGGRGRGRN